MSVRPHGLGRYKRGPDEHGRPGKGCRCGVCREANRARQRYRARMIAYGRWDGWTDGTGTRRRIQALMRGGWSLGLLAARLGCDRTLLHRRLHAYERVTAATAAAVSALYDELWDQAPPERDRYERGAATKTRKYARDRGFVPPLAWDDDEIDDPAAVPAPGWDTSPLAAAIREARVRAGLSRPRLAALVGVSRSAIQAWEDAQRAPGPENWVQLELTLGPLGVVRDRQEQATTEDERDAA